jgi:GH25 family lysozyme M1 (1,4-beta-N-acetylmuramidase)
MVLNVADVSSNNTADKSKGNNYFTAIDENDAVIIKVTEGLSYVNPLANDQYTYAKNKNKLIGLYHFIVGGLSPQQQAQYFFNTAKNYILNQPTLLMLDWERPASYPALTGDEHNVWR